MHKKFHKIQVCFDINCLFLAGISCNGRFIESIQRKKKISKKTISPFFFILLLLFIICRQNDISSYSECSIINRFQNNFTVTENCQFYKWKEKLKNNNHIKFNQIKQRIETEFLYQIKKIIFY